MVHSYSLSRIRLVSIENFLFNLTAIAIKSVPLKFSSVFEKDIHLLSAIFKLRRVTCLLSQKATWLVRPGGSSQNQRGKCIENLESVYVCVCGGDNVLQLAVFSYNFEEKLEKFPKNWGGGNHPLAPCAPSALLFH